MTGTNLFPPFARAAKPATPRDIGALFGLRCLINADVINQEFLRQNRVVNRSAPTAAEGEVEDEILRRAEGIARVLVRLVNEDGVVFLVVEKEINAFWRPLDGIDMEIIKRLVRVQRAAVGLMFAIHGIMQGAMNAGGFFADKFHDVNLAAARPADLRPILAEHPDGGPDAFALGDFGARLNASVLPTRLAASGQAGSGVFHRWEERRVGKEG